jgi:Cd2+/Zn2+-exporting ATPase
VYSGTLNSWGAVKVKVTRKAQESALQRIIHLIQQAQHLRAPSQQFTDKFGTKYTLGILGLTLVMFFVWWLAFGAPAFVSTPETKSAFYRAMTLLVVASPCALVLSIPSAILAAIASGARKGILFRGGAAIEKLAEVDVVAMDKTGTLTTGEMQVEAVESFPPGRERDVAEIAFSLETRSNHPLAKAIVAYGKKLGLTERKIDEFQSLTGKGLRGEVDEKVTYLGRRELLASGALEKWIRQVPDPPLSHSEVWIVHGELLGRLLLKDQIRGESKEVLDTLRRENVRTIVLTGDRRSAAETVARELGIQDVRAGLSPEDKLRIIADLGKEGHKVAMVGDGVNDAPSLAAAYVSVAMGGRGSDAALEQSDVALMHDRIEKFVTARHLSRAARGIIKQNLLVSLGTVIAMVGASLFGIIPLTAGVIAHEGSTVVVCLNSLRLLFQKF